MKTALQITLLAIVYVLTARLGQTLAIPPGNVTPVWLPSGIMLAALAFWGRHLWPSVFIGAFLGNAWAYFDSSSWTLALKALVAATLNGTGDCICVLIGLWALYRKLPKDAPLLKTPQNVLSFICIAAGLGSLVSALFGVTGLKLGGFIPSDAYLATLYTWFLGDMMGIILLFPAILALRELRARTTLRPSLELLAFMSAFSLVVYHLIERNEAWNHSVGWVLIVISMLLWSAFRFPWITTPMLMIVLSAALILANVAGMGPFLNANPNMGLLETQYYLLIIGSTGLMVCAEVAQRKALLKQNQTLTENLEQKVQEQTKELRQEVAHKNKIEQDLIFQEKAFKQAQSIANLGHWYLDHTNGKLTWSDETYAIFEKDPAQFEPSYQKFLAAVHPDDKDKVDQCYTRSLQAKHPYHIEHNIVLQGQRQKHVLENGLTYYAEDGTALYTIGTVQDITKESQRKADLIEAKERAEDANRAKMQFLSMMSHELRTPMNGVLGMAQLMELEPNLSEDAQGYLKTIIECGSDLMEILSSVLDFAKIDSGMQELKKTVYDLNQLTNSVLSLFKGVAKSKGIELINSINIPLLTRVYGDHDMMRRVLINLVGNAVKYTEVGSVKVTAHLSAETETSVTAVICVEDSGIGIPKDRINKIFNAFEQANTTLSRKYGGTGLGLAITQSLTHLMNGSISCESDEGHGSRFYVKLPLELEPRNSPNATANANSTKPSFATSYHLSGKVLIVEDDPDSLSLTVELLKRLGLKFEIARDGRQALEKGRQTRYDLILMDLILPEISGLDVTKRLRQEQGPNTKCPIISTTALVSKEDEKRSLQAGITANLKKPIIIAEFNQTLATYLTNSI